MAQQQTVTFPDGAVWEWDESNFEYACQHINVDVGTAEVDTMTSGEHDTYTVPTADCMDCGEDISENYDFDGDER